MWHLQTLFCLLAIYLASAIPGEGVEGSTPQESLQKLLSLDENEKFLWYAPHSGFGNQMQAFRNALRTAGILNRTLIVPPLLNHFELSYGDCNNYVASSDHMGKSVWKLLEKKLESRAYVSIADVVDISSVHPYYGRTIDLRLYAALRCGIDVSQSLAYCGWCGPIVEELRRRTAINFPEQLSNRDRLVRCGVDLGVVDPNAVYNGYQRRRSVYSVEKDCMTSVFMYQRNANGNLETSIPDSPSASCPQGPYFLNAHYYQKYLSDQRSRHKKRPFEYVNIHQYLGTEGTEAASAEIIRFGSTFVLFDLVVPTGDERADALSCVTDFLPFNWKIMSSAAKFVRESIGKPYACLHFRGGDGFFSDRRGKNLARAKKRLEDLRSSVGGSQGDPPKLFLMSDLMDLYWHKEFARQFPGYHIHFSSELWHFEEAIRVFTLTLASGVWTNRLSNKEPGQMIKEFWDAAIDAKVKGISSKEQDIKVYLEQVVCACAKLGFVDDEASTISANVVHLRAGNVCERAMSI